MTIKEILIELGMEGVTYDTAKPQPWWDKMSALGVSDVELRGYIWLYDEGDHFGRPFNVLTAYACHLIEKIDNKDLVPASMLIDPTFLAKLRHNLNYKKP